VKASEPTNNNYWGRMTRCMSSKQRRRRTNAKSRPNAGSLYVQLLVTSELTSVLIGARRQTACSSMWPYCVHHFLHTNRARTAPRKGTRKTNYSRNLTF